MKSEVRSPKSEVRKKAEALNPNSEAAPLGPSFLRTSDFGLRTSPHAPRSTLHASQRSIAFSLLEVMVACGIFFMATFAILALVSSTLRNARLLQRSEVDAGMAAAQVFQYLKTNREISGSISGDFGDAFPDFSWTSDWGPAPEANTNTLSRADIVVMRRGNQRPADVLSIWVFRPQASGTMR